MSLRNLLAVAVFGAAFSASAFAQAVAPAPGSETPAPTAAEPDATPEEIFQTVGWIIAERNNLAAFGMSETEMAAFEKGLASGAKGEPPPERFEAAQRAVQQFLNGRARAHHERQAAGNKIEEQDFLAKVDANPAVKKTASGLRYEITAPGTDPKPGATDTVVAHYTLKFADGTVVESSKSNDGQPAEFALNAVIPAWTEGLQLIGTGGKMKLYVPSALGYGEHGSPGGIPPAKVLEFDVELVGIKPTPVQLPGTPATPGMPTLTP